MKTALLIFILTAIRYEQNRDAGAQTPLTVMNVYLMRIFQHEERVFVTTCTQERYEKNSLASVMIPVKAVMDQQNMTACLEMDAEYS